MRIVICVCVLVVALVLLAQLRAEQDKSLEEIGRTYPLTVSGKALDETGRPIKGATVYLVSTGSSPARAFGEAVTQEDGRYEFRDAPLPESRGAKDAEQFRLGQFEVFGKAPERGFSWRGMKHFYVEPPPMSKERNQRDIWRKHGFIAGEKIELDLDFGPAKKIAGRFVDEGGKPIVGTELQLVGCDFVQPYATLSDKNWREFNAIHQARALMPDQVLAVTDSEGRFEFKSVPPEVLCRVFVIHQDYAALFFTSTAAEPPLTSYDGRPVLKLPIEMTLPSVRSVSIAVQARDGGQSIAGVKVTARQQSPSGIHSGGTSDFNGNVTLKLPPGRYELQGSPQKGLAAVQSVQDLVVEAAPDVQSTALRMEPACVLILKAIDAETGAGIPNVNFWHWTTSPLGGGTIRTSVQSTTSKVDNPMTDANGVLVAVVKPGRRPFGVGWGRLPEGYDFDDPDDRTSIGRTFDLPAGQTLTLEFKLRKLTK